MHWLVAVGIGAVLIVWVGYPLAIGFLASVIRRAVHADLPSDVSRRLTVVVATRDAIDRVVQRVVDLEAQVVHGTVDIVVGLDAEAPYRDEELAQALGTRARVVRARGPAGKAGALNAAVAAAAGDVVVLADTAQRFAPGTVERLAAFLDDSRFGAVAGSVQIGEGDAPQTLSEWYWRMERWLREREALLHSTVGVSGAIYGIRRTLWRELPDGIILDDLFAPMSVVLAGKRVGFCGDALAIDVRRFAGEREYGRKVRTLTGVVQLCVVLPEVLIPWKNPIFLQFVFHKLLRLATPLFLAVAAGGVTWWALAASLNTSSSGVARWGGVVGGALALSAVSLVPRLRRAVHEALLMQRAVVVAIVNGLRGNWNVWDATREPRAHPHAQAD